jgi:hypothetical protein
MEELMCPIGSQAKQSFAGVRSQTEIGTEEVWDRGFLHIRSSILYPRSSILDPRSSILDPRSSRLLTVKGSMTQERQETWLNFNLSS